MRENVTIAYRGANYEIGRGPNFYGIWVAGAPQSQPLEWWPETPVGWSSAWARFTGIEVPGTIVSLSPPFGPPPVPAAPASPPVTPGGQAATPGGAPVTPGGGPFTPGGQSADPGSPPAGETASWTARPAGAWTGRPGLAWTGRAGPGGLIAAGLLAAGVVVGTAGLFPSYLLGASLASQTYNLVPHLIYLAAWTAGAVLIVLGGARLRLGALLAAGTSIVTFGLFFADAGTAIAAGSHAMGAGLALGLAGWLLCALGSGMAFWLRPQGRPAPGRPQRWAVRHVLTLVAALGALGTAIAFAPSWDSYTLRAPDGASQYLTAGNAFANPGWVIAGDVAVMVALVAVVIVAALWRPVRAGAVLLAGAAIPMAAQAISALIEVGQPTSPAQFGIPPAEASQAGITITNGLTPVFWLYCAFVIVLLATCAWILLWPRAAAALDVPAPAGPYGPAASFRYGPAASGPYGTAAYRPAEFMPPGPADAPAHQPAEPPADGRGEPPADEPADALPDGFQPVAEQ